MINYVAYSSNTFLLHFDYTPYLKPLLKSMTNDMSSGRYLCPKNSNMLINYVSIYSLCTACEDHNWLNRPL